MEDRLAPAVVDLTGPEQYLLELTNRARANPVAEAARYGIDLNEGLAPGTLSAGPKAPLAPNVQLTSAIRTHLQYLTALGTISHTGLGGSTVGVRLQAAGYRWTAYGENLAVGVSAPVSQQSADAAQALLFVDRNVAGRGHRVVMLSGNFREAGVGFTQGPFQGRTAGYVGTDFGSRGGTAILTGVVYSDTVVGDDFYSVGEGLPGAAVVATRADGQRFETTTGVAGGYAIDLPAGTYSVTFTTAAGETRTQTVTVGADNVKVDYVPAAGDKPTDTPASPPPPPVNPPTTPGDPAAPNANPNSPSPSSVVLAAAQDAAIQFSVATDRGTEGTVRTYTLNNTLQSTLTPFPGFTGGVRTASADFNGDGRAEIVAGTGPGRSTRVIVFDGFTSQPLFTTDPFEADFTGGVYVAAGDVTGDGRAELIVTPDEGGGPRVRVYNGFGFTQIADFFGIEDPNFRGGARAAVGDVNGDSRGDVVVAAGFGGGPRIAAFDGTQLGVPTLSASGLPPKLFGDFFAFEPTLTNGVFIASGDVDGDGFAEVIAGGGPGGGPRVSVFDGLGLLGGRQFRDADFFAGDTDDRGGVRLAVKNLDNDRLVDLVTGSGTGDGSRVVQYAGSQLVGSNPLSRASFDAFPAFNGGVFVG